MIGSDLSHLFDTLEPANDVALDDEPAGEDTQRVVSAYLFDSNSGFWVLDEAGSETEIQGLVGSDERAEILMDEARRVA
ncbi:MAG: hypothetical protein WDN48_00780 [Pseudolabrys sp.]